MDEKALVKQAVKGDKNAFAQLYMLYRDRLYRYAYFKLGDPDDAQDAASECITAAFRNISSLKNEKTFEAWIFRILYRCCCALIRRRMIERENKSADTREQAVSFENNILAAELKEALAQLDETDRDIVLLSAEAGFNSREIGDMLGMKPSTVRSRLSRSLSKMKEFLR